jgi:ferredoxin
VLKPSLLEWGSLDLAKPLLAYDRAYCQFECDRCIRVCPTGALRPLPLEAKKRSRLGRSLLKIELCIVVSKGTRCGACAEHCPSGALTMLAPAVPRPPPGLPGLPEPVIDEDYCIGCGACETVCPVRPERAIHVEGRAVQDLAKVRESRPGDLRDVQGTRGGTEAAPGVQPAGTREPGRAGASKPDSKPIDTTDSPAPVAEFPF